jgi:putative PIN family toxin of toxin-antitoxin system
VTRAVFDTSTLVGAVIHATSVPHRAWLCAHDTCEIIATVETFAELEAVLNRDRLQRFIHRGSRDQFLRMYRDSVQWISLSEASLAAVLPDCRDPKDGMFLALALIGKANVLISSDQDLLVLHPWRGILILTPAQFLGQFGQSETA